jgi:hypothetical protein
MGMMILSVTLLGLAAATATAARRVVDGRTEMKRWTVLQQQVEEIVRMGYDSVTSGNRTVDGYPVRWTVTGTNPKSIGIVVTWKNSMGKAVEDSMLYYLASPDSAGGS